MKNQQGYILIMLMLVLISIGAVVSYSLISPQQLQNQILQQRVETLQHIKQKLIIHSQSAPEIYATESNGNFIPGANLPSPGYLPCPDTDNDGQSDTPCGQGEDIVIGRLPITLATRHFRLIDSFQPFIWYIVDSRYVIQNADYNNPPLKRFTPLNMNHPGQGHIQLDQQDNLVALLIWSIDQTRPDEISTAQLSNIADLSEHRFHSNDDVTATLSHNEWRNAVLNRVGLQKATLCDLPADQPHWFNACNNQQGSGTAACDNDLNKPDNPTGANWREELC